MIKAVLSFLIVFNAFWVSGQPMDELWLHYFVLDDATNLEIKGKSNVTDFSCKLNSNFERDTVVVSFSWGNESIWCHGGNIRFRVQDFSCENPVMTKDFQKTLKADEHPYISLEVHKLFLDPALEKQMRLNTEVGLVVAGIRQDYITEFDKISFMLNGVGFEGKQPISLNQFDLVPPRIMMGLIKISEEMAINFSLNIRRVSMVKPSLKK